MRARGIIFAAVASLFACACGLAACGSFSADTPAPVPPAEAGPGTDASADGDAQVDASAPDGGAPDGTVVVAAGNLGTFYIDAHEVTFGEYAAFVAAVEGHTATPSMPARCSWKTTFAPDATCASSLPSTAVNHPVGCVDWCDAFAYCQFRGERLCGKIGGGPVDSTLGTTQWATACSGVSGMSYPYGSTADDTACWTAVDGGPAVPAAVGTARNCSGSVAGLVDMSGNVWEWEDECGAVDAGRDVCIFRGGSISDPASGATCFTRQNRQLDFASFNVGFRCCADR